GADPQVAQPALVGLRQLGRGLLPFVRELQREEPPADLHPTTLDHPAHPDGCLPRERARRIEEELDLVGTTGDLGECVVGHAFEDSRRRLTWTPAVTQSTTGR